MRSSARCLPSSVRGVALAAALAAVLSLVACSSGAPTAAPGVTAPTISGAWVRPPMGTDRPAAGYLVIAGGSQADALISISSPIAGTVELHETTTDSSGMTGMHPIGRLDVPAGGTITLQPGGYHLMFLELTGTITVGGTVQIELTFEKAGKITVQAEVRQG